MKAVPERPEAPDPPASLPTRVARSSTSIRMLAVIALGTLLYLAHAVVIPVVLAILFALILTAPVEALHRFRIPRIVTALALLLAILGLLSGAIDWLSAPAEKWWDSAPQTLRTIERKLQPVSKLVNKVEQLTDRAGHLNPSTQQPTPQRPAASTPSEGNVAAEVFATTRTAIVSTLTTTILALFLLAGGPPLLARLTAAAAKDLEVSNVLTVIDAVRSEVSRYYASIALINLGLGAATFVVMMLLGMPNPLLWGVIAAVLNFVPYVGSATTLLLLLIVAFVSFDNVARVLAVGASYLALTTLEGQLIQPLVVGRRLELNPIIVFLALWFGGWFWGIAGIVIAVPSLVALKVIAQHSDNGEALIQFLSPNDDGAVKTLTARAGQSIRKIQRRRVTE
jgi:predicted PurR-regulated permease PerM